MSYFTLKNHSGLIEAYASIYKQTEQITEEQVDQEIYFEDLEVDTDILVDAIVDCLVAEGYANTDDQALNMIPHMSDAWLDNIAANFVIEQNFIDCINSIVEEGYDLSSYTVDELYEEYVGYFNNCLNEDHRMDLHEVVPLLAAPLLANPATWAAGAGLAAGAAYAGKKAIDAYRQMRSGTSAEGERWLQQGVLQARTRKQAQDQKRLQQGKERVLQRQQQKAAQQPAKPPAPAQPAAGGAPPAGPTPPKPPKGPGPFDKAKDLLKQGLGLQPSQSIKGELAKKTLVKTGQVLKATPGAVKGFFTSPKPAVRALKTLGVAELGSFAGRTGKSPTGEVLKGAGSVLKGLGGAAQQAPKEAGAIQKGVSAYQQAKEQKPKPPVKAPESLPGFQ